MQLTTCNGRLTDAVAVLRASNPNLAQGPKLSRTGPAVMGCRPVRLRGALGYEKDAAHFTFL